MERARSQDWERLRGTIAQWNDNRLDLFELSEPDQSLNFHGVMRWALRGFVDSQHTTFGESCHNYSVRHNMLMHNMLILCNSLLTTIRKVERKVGALLLSNITLWHNWASVPHHPAASHFFDFSFPFSPGCMAGCLTNTMYAPDATAEPHTYLPTCSQIAGRVVVSRWLSILNFLMLSMS